MHPGARRTLIGVGLLLVAGCPATEPDHDVTVREIAETTIEEPPTPPLVWTGRKIATPVDHDHGWSVVFAAFGPHTVEMGGERIELGVGEGTTIPGDATHSHGEGPALEITLEKLGAERPDDVAFETSVLEGAPLGPATLRMLVVDLGPDGATRAQEFPGPVLVMAVGGTVVVEFAGGAEVTLEADGHHLVPGDAPIRLVNPSGSRHASTLLVALVDADAEFVPPAPDE